METQDCMCSNEYETHLHHQHSSSVRLQGKNRFLWGDVKPVSPAGMPLPNYWPLLPGHLKLNLNMSWPKMKENLDCLKLQSVICAGIRNEQTDLAGAEEGMVSGSSMWNRKCSEPNWGSFVHLWIFFSKSSIKSSTILWAGERLCSMSQTCPMTTNRVFWCPYHSAALQNSQNDVLKAPSVSAHCAHWLEVTSARFHSTTLPTEQELAHGHHRCG